MSVDTYAPPWTSRGVSRIKHDKVLERFLLQRCLTLLAYDIMRNEYDYSTYV